MLKSFPSRLDQGSPQYSHITTSVQQCTKVLANPAREENENNWWNVRKNFKWNYFKWAWLCEKSEKNSTDEILELLKEFNKFESKR